MSLLTAMTMTSPAWAEAPMNTDDAGTLARGGMKIEGVWSRDDKADTGSLAFGFSPVDNLELEVSAERGHDTAVDPALRQHSLGFGAKWVPYQNETGWSLGARLDFCRARIEDRTVGATGTEREAAIAGLASYRWAAGYVLHLNLGATRLDTDGGDDTAGTWSAGFELPVAERLQFTVETFGAEHVRPDKAAGLRYELREGLKFSGAVGHGNDRSFGQVGLAWEF